MISILTLGYNVSPASLRQHLGLCLYLQSTVTQQPWHAGLLHPVHHLPADCSIMIHSFYHSTPHYSIILFYHSILSLNHPIMLHSARQILARWTGCARLKTRRRGAQCAAGLTTAGKKSELAERADQRLGQRSSSSAQHSRPVFGDGDGGGGRSRALLRFMFMSRLSAHYFTRP